MTPDEQLLVEAARRGLLPKQEARKRTAGEYMEDFGRGVASGATFGFADEIAARANSMGEDIPAALGAPDPMAGLAMMAGKKPIPNTLGPAYREALAAERARDKEASPYAKIPGEIAGGVGTAVGLGRSGLSLLNAAKPTVGSMVGRGAAEGALYGAAHGAGAGEGAQDRLTQAAYGGTLGALTGGAMGLVGAKMAKPSAKAPTPEELAGRATAAYKSAEDAGVVVSQSSWSQVVDDIATKLKDKGMHPRIHPKTAAALDELVNSQGTQPALKEIDTLRKIARQAAASNEPSERKLARTIIDKIDDYVSNLSAKDVVAGDAEAGAAALKQARALWMRKSKTEAIGDLIERARNQASQFSGSGFENALRTQFRNLAQNPRRMRVFSEAEQDAIRSVARGGTFSNALRFVGKMAPRGVVSGGFNLGVGVGIDPTLGFATMAAGEAGRRGATALTSRNAQRAVDMMATGGNLPQPQQLLPAYQRLLDALIAAEAQQAPRAIPLNTGR